MASLIEFIEQVGLENITCQTLHESITSVKNVRGGGSEVSFQTQEITASDFAYKLRKTAFIVWIDADRFDAALKELQGK